MKKVDVIEAVAVLWLACQKRNDGNVAHIRRFYHRESMPIFSYCQQASLCDEYGTIDEETRAVIRSSVKGFFYAPSFPMVSDMAYPLGLMPILKKNVKMATGKLSYLDSLIKQYSEIVKNKNNYQREQLCV